MKNINISSEDLELMNYNDVAYIILENNKNQMKIADLFKGVCKVMNLDDDEFQSHIGDFFELLSTDKRFIMLENGYWDLKINHNKGIVIDDDEEEEEILLEEENNENDYNKLDIDPNNDDDIEEDDLADLVIIDTDDDDNN